MFYVYIVTNRKNGTLYHGQTDDLPKRIWEHKNKIFRGFASKYNLAQLVWYEVFDTRADAFAVERRMKAWKQEWKISRIVERNPEWADLYFKL